MIKEDVYIKDYDWIVHFYFAIDTYYVKEIIDLLWNLDCDADTMTIAHENLSSGDLNNGICYSNPAARESVVVTAMTTSAAQFANSLFHELSHLLSHICKYYHMKPTGEPIAYLSGDIIMHIYPRIKHLLCDCCRQEYEYE